jgi:hypothetical protein
MARTAIAATQITLAGIVLNVAGGTAADAVNGNYISTDNNGSTLFILANNTGGSPYTVTFVTPGTHGAGGYAITDEIKTLAAGDIKLFGPFPLSDFSKQLQIDTQNAAVKLSAFWI